MERLLKLFSSSLLLVTNSGCILKTSKINSDKEMKAVRYVRFVSGSYFGVSYLAFYGDNYCPLLMRVRNSHCFPCV